MLSNVPFNQCDELRPVETPPSPRQPLTHVPNEPFIPLADTTAVQDYLEHELQCKLLDNLQPYLYYVAKKSNEHIEPLHRHILKSRKLVVVEQPSLHLVWDCHIIYLKPLPHCLLSYEFWEEALVSQDPEATRPQRISNQRAALGLLRSYTHLIQHESDFDLAVEHYLVPKGTQYRLFQYFIRNFRVITDDDVSARYQYGQFRLTRLNLILRCLKLYLLVFSPNNAKDFPWGYEYRITDSGKTGSIIHWLTAPFIGAFVLLSLILSSAQVLLAARPEEVTSAACYSFAIAVILLLTFLCFVFFTVLLALFSAQFHYGRMQKVREKEQHPC